MMQFSAPEVISFARECKQAKTDVFFCLPAMPKHNEMRRFAEGIGENTLVLLPGTVYSCSVPGITVLHTTEDLQTADFQTIAYMDIRLFANEEIPVFLADRQIRELILPFYECALITEYGYKESYMSVSHARASILFPMHITAISAGDYITDPVFEFLGVTDHVLIGDQTAPSVSAFKTLSQKEKQFYTEALCEKYILKRTIVQCPTRADAEMMLSFLLRRKTPAALFHGGRTFEQNQGALADFTSGRVNILIATKSLLPAVPFLRADQVLFFGLPYSLPHAYRCAALNKSSELLCIYCDEDIDNNRKRSDAFYQAIGATDDAFPAAREADLTNLISNINR